MQTVVWAFQPLAELNHKTGFVICDAALGARLIASGAAQDPREGANNLRHITSAVAPTPAAPPARVDDADVPEYQTKVMTPKRRRGSK